MTLASNYSSQQNYINSTGERESNMLIVQVNIQLKPEHREAFILETIENARHSVEEPGIARFDFLQYSDEPNHFILIEVYRDENAPAQHKETAHYQHWRDAVADMMAEPRTSIKYKNIYPDDQGWG
jgi:(4S)-4-hydroxy-5-phosphonooxypentane-2,3-dione isomerase